MNGARVSGYQLWGTGMYQRGGESSYGLVVHLLLLSTPLHATQLQSATGCSVYLERTCTSLIECACRRTSPWQRRGWRGGISATRPWVLGGSYDAWAFIPIALLWAIMCDPAGVKSGFG